MAVKPSQEVLRVAQEISFAKALAGNDKSLRDRALKRLGKWFASMPSKKESFNDASFSRLWKGLYYCVWMSDKPLIQEQCVDRISNLIHSLRNVGDMRKFVIGFFNCMSQYWMNLDGFRFDKYLMLVRRFLRQLLERLQKSNWDQELVENVLSDFTSCLIAAPTGLNLHVVEIYLEELAKIGRGQLTTENVFEFIKPFGVLLSTTKDLRLMMSIKENIFYHLLRQSDLALKHQAKFNVWRSMGFPGGSIDVLQEVPADENGTADDEDDEQEADEDADILDGDESDADDEGPLDPRAGRVDVLLPPLEFDAVQIAEYLASLKHSPDLCTKARKHINQIIYKFETFQKGKYPLGIHQVEQIEEIDEHELVEKAAEKLSKVERKLIEESDLYSTSKADSAARKSNSTSLKRKLLSRKRKRTTSWETTPMKTKKSSDPSTPATEGSWEVSKLASPDPMEIADVSQDSAQESTPLAGKSGIFKKKSALDVVKLKKKKKLSNGTAVSESPWGDSSWENVGNEVKISPMRDCAAASLERTPASFPLSNGHSLPATTGSGKKVAFVLHKNCSQEEKEYKQTVKKRPSIPYDAEKKPPQGVLKSPALSSQVTTQIQFPPALAEIS
ncbi:Nucleolar protein,Nop52 [Nesidiocoris tenuis]|uniref:Nucleolar protein,Nop52 n=1 Tax=Nesidiocoris tenuis TaxID=355587 RepID=A0ABN7AA59_9HEMI|nr:Nucleolar protein,Nop52 [Nesidiocoris tenuis]